MFVWGSGACPAVHCASPTGGMLTSEGQVCGHLPEVAVVGLPCFGCVRAVFAQVQ